MLLLLHYTFDIEDLGQEQNELEEETPGHDSHVRSRQE